MQRLRSARKSLATLMPARILKKKATSAVTSVQDTYYSAKELFERHRVVFTVSTSIASVVTAWVGYSIRTWHQSRVEKRLDSIEHSLREHSKLEKTEIKKMVTSGSTAASLATAGTTFLIGNLSQVWLGLARRTMASSKAVPEGANEINGADKTKNMATVTGIRPKGLQLLAGIKRRGAQLQFLKRPLARFKGD